MNDGEDVDGAIDALNAAKPTSGLVSWDVVRSIDERRGQVVGELAVFESVEDFHTWRVSDLHMAAVDYMRPKATWLIADWNEHD